MSEFAVAPACLNHPDVIEGIQRCARCARPFCRDCTVTIGGNPYCADCKSEQLLDLRSGIDATTLPYASRGRRLVALILDYLPWSAISMILVFRSMFNGRPMSGFSPLFVGIGASFIIYEGLMLQWKSATFGKMLMGMRVTRVDGSNVSPGQAWGRTVARWALNFLYLVDWLPIFFTQERLCVHDMLAKTRVIRVE
jgi:uncharacterized RDD family membrane protein YckC